MKTQRDREEKATWRPGGGRRIYQPRMPRIRGSPQKWGERSGMDSPLPRAATENSPADTLTSDSGL